MLFDLLYNSKNTTNKILSFFETTNKCYMDENDGAPFPFHLEDFYTLGKTTIRTTIIRLICMFKSEREKQLTLLRFILDYFAKYYSYQVYGKRKMYENTIIKHAIEMSDLDITIMYDDYIFRHWPMLLEPIHNGILNANPNLYKSLIRYKYQMTMKIMLNFVE